MISLHDKIIPTADSNESTLKCRFIAEIGRGGMSEVYLTVTEGGLVGFQKLVVVKLLRRDLAEDEEFRRMFLTEACLAARLNHPNVVQTNDVGEHHGRYYISMEYLEGQTFERVRRARNAAKYFPLSMQIQMLVQVLSGLHYAHELADYDGTPILLVHRDVTPSNVFLTYDGQVKLLDFGIAKVLDSVNQTRAGVLKGKARYMAPEQIVGGVIDRQADVFSVGVMLWEILVGKPIWGGHTEADILRRVSLGEMPQLPADAQPMLRQICMKAMAHRPADRYPTAEALRAELDTYLAQHVTPSQVRDMGAAVSELFAEDQARIRHLIESEVRGSHPASNLSVLGDLRAASNSSLREVPSGSARVGVSPSVQLMYSGVAKEPQKAMQAASPSRKRLYLVGGAIAALAIAGGAAFLWKGNNAKAALVDEPKAAGAVRVAEAPPLPHASPGVTVNGITDDEVLIGMSSAFSGPSRELGGRMKLGVETAFAMVNDAGGVAGRTLKLSALDDGYDDKRALANTQELITDKKVFAIVGNVGTPTAKLALPYAVSKKVLFFGAFTGANLLRKDPPDRYVFNYRASYEEETAKMVNYLLEVKKIQDHGIVVFAQRDSYGDAGYEGATKMLRKKGRNDELFRANYERNTVDVDDAVNKIVEYHNATVRVRSGTTEVTRQKHPVKAIIMVGTYKAAARFIQKIRDRKIDAIFLNVSFVGSGSLAEELKELGPSYAEGVIVTQVVPHFDSGATGVLRYREALKKYHPDQQPDFVSLEGFIVGQLFAEGLRRAGREIDTESLVETFESIQNYDPGTGGSLSFGVSQHQASHKVWGTQIDKNGEFISIDMD